MRCVVLWLRVVFPAFIAGCVLIAFAQGKEGADEVLKAYKAAHAKKDVAAMMALVLFQSGGAAEKSSWRDDFEAETRKRVTVKLVPLADYAVMLSPEVRKRIRPSITLVNFLVVEYPPQDKSIQRSGLYPIGKENGRFFIVGP
jgi:hypothetical protein